MGERYYEKKKDCPLGEVRQAFKQGFCLDKEIEIIG
jgi:hypothetical protein